MRVIIYDDPDRGSAVVLHPAYNDQVRPAGETDDQLIARVIAQSVPADVTYSIMDDSDIPRDRTNRDLWRCDHIAGAIITGG